MTSDKFFKPLEQRQAQLKELQAKLRTAEKRASSLEVSIQGHKSYIPETDETLIVALQKKQDTIASTTAKQRAAHEILTASLIAKREQQVGFLQLRKFFSAEQKTLRGDISQVNKRLITIKKTISEKSDEMNTAQQACTQAKARLSAHAAFDLKTVVQNLAEARSEAKRVLDLTRPLELEIQKMETENKVHILEYKRLQSELNNIVSEIQTASKYQKQLNEAPDAAHRARIHEKCNNHFGSGNPSKVIRERSSRKEALERSISKVGYRILEEFTKFDRKIERLIIDGNNLCYDRKKFIGLRALKALIDKIANKYEIVIIFDSNIRSLLKANDHGISSTIGYKNIHITPTGTSADEYILKIAGDDSYTFIISNDRFVDFHDYSAVKSGRILRFMVAEGQIMVNALNVTAKFANE
ncbi:hypothetical protein [Brevundimonas sp.]|uniref:hypothetical protein n=1 Tax=Brevundimonas sp. TaxID=1871086 RepID=UPI00289C1440|nr:hypothetical protein [Brevundimonas sp.]